MHRARVGKWRGETRSRVCKYSITLTLNRTLFKRIRSVTHNIKITMSFFPHKIAGMSFHIYWQIAELFDLSTIQHLTWMNCKWNKVCIQSSQTFLRKTDKRHPRFFLIYRKWPFSQGRLWNLRQIPRPNLETGLSYQGKLGENSFANTIVGKRKVDSCFLCLDAGYFFISIYNFWNLQGH